MLGSLYCSDYAPKGPLAPGYSSPAPFAGRERREREGADGVVDFKLYLFVILYISAFNCKCYCCIFIYLCYCNYFTDVLNKCRVPSNLRILEV